jgi:spore germination cell wall hydrolase CwlJ-like protein
VITGLTVATQAALVCLTQVIYHEARSEPIEGQYAVAEVILNRVNSNRYPDNICDVVFQRKQFSFTEMNDLEMRETRARNQAFAIALQMIYEPAIIYVGDSLWYHADYVDPYWASVKTEVTQIGAHIFYEK